MNLHHNLKRFSCAFDHFCGQTVYKVTWCHLLNFETFPRIWRKLISFKITHSGKSH